MELSHSKIAVTGASGFLGRYLVRALQQRGAKVVAVIRNPENAAELEASGVEVRIADLSDVEALAQSFTGVDAVIGNAALVELYMRTWDDYLETNIEGTINVFEALHAAGVRRCVHMSSVAIYRSHYPPVGEDTPCYGEKDRVHRFNAYGLSKALSEETAWRYAKKFEIALTALRPAVVYGAFDPNFSRWHKRLVRGRVLSLYPCIARFGLVHAGDVAEAAMLALEHPDTAGTAYNVCGDDWTLWEFAKEWAALDPKAAPLRIPIPAPYRRRYDSSRIREQLGWAPRPLSEGIRETLEQEGAELAIADDADQGRA